VSVKTATRTRQTRKTPVPSVRRWLDDCADACGEGILVADGLDEALVGLTCYQSGRSTVCAVYDYERCVAVFRKQGMTDDEAREWMDFNVVGAWVGDGTPVFLTKPGVGDE